MVSATSALAVLAILAMGALAVGASVVGGPVSADAASSGYSGQGRCDVASAIQDAVGHRSPGETVGSVISEIAKACRPDFRR